MKHTGFFNDFLNEHVNLDQSRLKQLNGHVDAVQRFLRRNLAAYQKIERQGSYALGTIIKPVRDGQEYDADILLYMDFDSAKEAKNYIKDLYDCLRSNATYAEKAHRRTRCVELDYTGEFHLDIVPCIDDLDGKQRICNYKTNEFEPSDGTGYRDWFNEKTKITGGNLKRVTRLLKYLRDHKGTFAVKSILLTTLVGNTVYGESDRENFKTVPDALKTVSNRNGRLSTVQLHHAGDRESRTSRGGLHTALEPEQLRQLQEPIRPVQRQDQHRIRYSRP